MMNQALVAAGAVFVLSACASSQPPPELVDARTVYARVATRSEASRLAPQALNEARVALAAAEEPYQKGAPEYLVRDRAYIAIRAAELAQIYAATERTKDEIAKLPGKAADMVARVAAAERKIDEAEKPPAVEPEPEPPPARGPTTSALSIDDESRGTVITVPAPALFRAESTDFLPGAEARLEPVAKALTDEQKTKILVETRTESVGSAVDPGLSQRRADLVRNFLVSHDVKPDRVSVAHEDTGGGKAIAQPQEEADGRPNIIVSLKTPSP